MEAMKLLNEFLSSAPGTESQLEDLFEIVKPYTQKLVEAIELSYIEFKSEDSRIREEGNGSEEVKYAGDGDNLESILKDLKSCVSENDIVKLTKFFAQAELSSIIGVPENWKNNLSEALGSNKSNPESLAKDCIKATGFPFRYAVGFEIDKKTFERIMKTDGLHKALKKAVIHKLTQIEKRIVREEKSKLTRSALKPLIAALRTRIELKSTDAKSVTEFVLNANKTTSSPLQKMRRLFKAIDWRELWKTLLSRLEQEGWKIMKEGGFTAASKALRPLLALLGHKVFDFSIPHLGQMIERAIGAARLTSSLMDNESLPYKKIDSVITKLEEIQKQEGISLTTKGVIGLLELFTAPDLQVVSDSFKNLPFLIKHYPISFEQKLKEQFVSSAFRFDEKLHEEMHDRLRTVVEEAKEKIMKHGAEKPNWFKFIEPLLDQLLETIGTTHPKNLSHYLISIKGSEDEISDEVSFYSSRLAALLQELDWRFHFSNLAYKLRGIVEQKVREKGVELIAKELTKRKLDIHPEIVKVIMNASEQALKGVKRAVEIMNCKVEQTEEFTKKTSKAIVEHVEECRKHLREMIEKLKEKKGEEKNFHYPESDRKSISRSEKLNEPVEKLTRLEKKCMDLEKTMRNRKPIITSEATKRMERLEGDIKKLELKLKNLKDENTAGTDKCVELLKLNLASVNTVQRDISQTIDTIKDGYTQIKGGHAQIRYSYTQIKEEFLAKKNDFVEATDDKIQEIQMQEKQLISDIWNEKNKILENAKEFTDSVEQAIRAELLKFFTNSLKRLLSRFKVSIAPIDMIYANLRSQVLEILDVAKMTICHNSDIVIRESPTNRYTYHGNINRKTDGVYTVSPRGVVKSGSNKVTIQIDVPGMQETPYLVFPNNLEGLLKAGFYRDQILRFWNLDSSEEDKLNFKAETRDSHLHEYSGLYSKLPAHIDNLISVVKSSDVSALVEWVLKSATEFDAAINVTAREMPKICTLISEEAANLKNKLLKSKMGNIVPRYLKRRFSLFDSRTVAKVSKENKDVWMKDGGIRILLIHTGKVPKNWEALSRMLKGKAVLGHMVDESQSDNAPSSHHDKKTKYVVNKCLHQIKWDSLVSIHNVMLLQSLQMTKWVSYCNTQP
eukprot:jgi/Bigna1/76419/fgenesh1_pg.41_\